MLLLLESGRSHPEIGTKGVQSYMYTVCILYTVYCKVVGTHRVLHLGSIERERVTREWASDVPCGYYGMIYLGGVYILGVHMGHKFISFSLLAWSIGLDASLRIIPSY